MLAGILVVTGMRDEVFIRGQQLGDDVLVLFQHVLNEHPGVVNEHGRVPLVNLLSTAPVVVLDHRPRTVEAEVLIKLPLHARLVFTIPSPGRQLFIQQLPHELGHVFAGFKLPLLDCRLDVPITVRSLIG